MQYVKIDDETGEVLWDDYFAYVRAARTEFPAALYAFASNWDHYSLDGANTLHDAWLSGTSFDHKLKGVVLEFLAARHDRKIRFQYVTVAALAFNLDVEFRWGDRDVLAHEFRIEGGLVVHEIAFSKGDHILVRAGNVIPTVETLS